MTLLQTNAYVITLNWLRGHSNEVAETYFRTNGIPFERFDCMYYVTEGRTRVIMMYMQIRRTEK